MLQSFKAVYNVLNKEQKELLLFSLSPSYPQQEFVAGDKIL